MTINRSQVDAQDALASIMAIARSALGHTADPKSKALSTIFNLKRRSVEGPNPDQPSTTARAKALYRARRARERVFGTHADLFSEPAWDIMLDLFIADAEGRRVSVSSACIASRAAQTTALRWIATMERRGLLVRANDPLDGRRSFLCLTDAGNRLLEDALVQF